MGSHKRSIPIHEATFLTNGKVIDTDCLRAADLDSIWVDYFEELLTQGGGVMDNPAGHWRLVIHHDTPSIGLVSLAIQGRCLCTMLLLTGQDMQEERTLIYRFLYHLAQSKNPNLAKSPIPVEPNFDLLSITQRPLLAVVVFEGFDTLSSAMALDTSTFLAAAWFHLHAH